MMKRELLLAAAAAAVVAMGCSSSQPGRSVETRDQQPQAYSANTNADLVGPAGADGPQGPAGAQGPAGPQGDAGLFGDPSLRRDSRVEVLISSSGERARADNR